MSNKEIDHTVVNDKANDQNNVEVDYVDAERYKSLQKLQQCRHTDVEITDLTVDTTGM